MFLQLCTYNPENVGLEFSALFILTTAQQLDTKVGSHVADLPHISVFFGRLQGSV
jgi:hypothetical protein